MTRYAHHVSAKQTPQSEQARPDQVENSAGGFTFAVDKWKQLDRFLVLGAEGGSYYISERKLTKTNAKAVLSCIKDDGKRTVDRITEISVAGRAPKNDPAIFALALCVAEGDPDCKQLALAALDKVCRIGTHLFQFADSIEQLSGWGRALTRAVSNWYLGKEADKLAYQLVKYQGREGWTHRDIMRKAHMRGIEDASAAHKAIARWVVDREHMDAQREVTRKVGKAAQTNGGATTYGAVNAADLPAIIGAFEKALRLKEKSEMGELCKLIREQSLPRECVATEALQHPEVWEALLEKMPMTAMIRNLGKMTSIGILGTFSDGEKKVIETLGNKEALKKARVHPLAVLIAQRIYAKGAGMRGNLSWETNQRIVDALDGAFYDAFDVVEPTGKRHYIGLDVSGSMTCSMSNTPLTCREAAAALAMVTARVEKQSAIFGFCHEMTEIDITPKDRLDTVIDKTSHLPFGGTDCALPMIHALQKKIPVDAFMVLTDSETWAGAIHPHQALKQYRDQMGLPAKLVVVGMVANEFSIADPNDAGQLDVVGFDTSVPAILADFICE